MRWSKRLAGVLLVGSIAVLIGAGNRSTIQATAERAESADDDTHTTASATQPRSLNDESTSDGLGIPQNSAAVAPAFNLNGYSVNGGGATGVSSTSYEMGLSMGQSVAGFVSGTAYRLGVGFWYGVAGGGTCPIAMTGDVNLSTSLTSADIIYLVNFVFKGQAAPLPCEASGDANCSGTVTSADIIFMVNHVFKGQAAPCDVCTLFPGMWSCP